MQLDLFAYGSIFYIYLILCHIITDFFPYSNDLETPSPQRAICGALSLYQGFLGGINLKHQCRT